MNRLSFWLDDQLVEVPPELPGTTTLLRFLREQLGVTAVKEGCGEGDCGACTVALLERGPDGSATYRAVNSCMLFLPMVHGRRVYTARGLARGDALHPVQEAVVEHRAAQCGFCTPGIVMSLFEACYREDLRPGSREPANLLRVEEQVAGNLCRCTGYRPIRDAALEVAGLRPADRFLQLLQEPPEEPSRALEWVAGGQRYFQPASLDELFELRRSYPEAVLVAGGTDLALRVNKRHLFQPDEPVGQWPVVIGLEALDELRELREDELDGRPALWIGAGVTVTRLQDFVEGRLPGLEHLLHRFASRQVRNRATVGGNLCTASPVGDLAPAFLALGARAVIAGPGGRRELPLERFFPAYRRTALEGPELLLAVRLPLPAPGQLYGAYKVSKRRETDIATVSAAFSIRLSGGRVSEARLAYGGMAPTPARAPAAEAALRGRPWEEPSLLAAQEALDRDFTPISDLRASADYRRAVARNLLRVFFLESRGELEERDPRFDALPGQGGQA